MTYERPARYWIEAQKTWGQENGGKAITFCSCVLKRTKLEQNPTKREIVVMWVKDTMAGVGLMLFMVSAFVLASGAHQVIAPSV